MKVAKPLTKTVSRYIYNTIRHCVHNMVIEGLHNPTALHGVFSSKIDHSVRSVYLSGIHITRLCPATQGASDYICP